MELDLVGKTVTQALAMVRRAVAEHEGERLVLKLDNETVKLNLYSHIGRMGLTCKSERRGLYHYLELQLEGRGKGGADPSAAPGDQFTKVPSRMAFTSGFLFESPAL